VLAVAHRPFAQAVPSTIAGDCASKTCASTAPALGLGHTGGAIGSVNVSQPARLRFVPTLSITMARFGPDSMGLSTPYRPYCRTTA